MGGFGQRRWDFNAPINSTGILVPELQLSADGITWETPFAYVASGPTWIQQFYGVLAPIPSFYRILQRPRGLGIVSRPIEVTQQGIAATP